MTIKKKTNKNKMTKKQEKHKPSRLKEETKQNLVFGKWNSNCQVVTEKPVQRRLKSKPRKEW